jgi:hypothetical protein
MAHRKQQQQKPPQGPPTAATAVAARLDERPGAPPAALRARWEYRVSWIPTFLFDEESATWGAEGWELVACLPRQAQALKTDPLTGGEERITTGGADCYWKRLLVEEEEGAAS